MPKAAARNDDLEKTHDADRDWIVLGLLESVERDGAQSQRLLATELGIALGLVNAYLKRCVNKGLVKVNEVPARRYAYFLTPQGFAEKSRLTVQYLSHSFSFFRRAKGDCSDALAHARTSGMRQIALAGVSDLAEIAVICAPESGVGIAALVDAAATQPRFAGLPVVGSYDAVEGELDGILITDLATTRETLNEAIARFGSDRVLVPALLRGRLLNHLGHKS
ncbi:MAG: winged helix-turn-helix transcriptional regulator [Pseudorhodoplanes sp.]|nr:winged helix-turn-helix transcriptional regulator [Pseudorhodoplanes sp.]